MVQIVDQWGRPLKKETLKTEQTVKLAASMRVYPDHPSRGLNIRKLPRILQAAEQGSLAAQACLFADMEEKDGHLYAEMQKRKNALLTLDWSIEPPRNASKAELELTAAVDDWVRGIPDLEDIILNGASSIGYGFSCQEIAWELIDRVWLPESINLRPHYWFNTLPNKGDEIRLDDGSYHNGVPGAELWPFGWLVHKHNARSGFVASSALFRVCAWPYLFKNFALRDLAEFLEIYGLPARIAYYPQGTSDEDRDTILQALVMLGHDAVAALPQGNEIRFESAASGGSDPFLSMVSWAERTMSKAILGGTLTSQADGKASTNALGNVHNEVRHDILIGDAKQLEGMFDSLIQMLAALNGYGDIHPRRLPHLEFDTQMDGDISTFATALTTLVTGARVPDIPLSWVRKRAGIPTPKDNEPVLTLPSYNHFSALNQTPDVAKIAALSQQHEPQPDPDPAQDALDNAGPQVAINQGMETLLAPLITALEDGTSADDAMKILAASWPELPDGQLQQLLERAIFVADVWGRLHADT